MKATQRTQRRSSRQTGPSISLFPFLAVLICTMGALVPLLLAITRTARLQAEAAALAKLSEQGAELQMQREDVRWRIEQLRRSRTRTESQLADARLQLGHLEDHSRRLRDKLAQYQRTVGDFESLENVDKKRVAQSQAELEQVRTQIDVAQRQIAQAHQAAAGRSRSYAVVPYEGPNQTHRRPIYLECREDAVVLQPEGIEMTEADFDGPLGPGNPLAAALRAAREYMLAERDFDPQAGEPYPMLLVRPEGINAYYAARAAMKSWGFDFGYELVDDGWKLAYPPPDKRLADVVRQVIASARVSQARLAAAAPRHYGSRPKVAYRASPSGGFIREGGSSDDDRGYSSARPAGPVGGRERGEGREERGEGTTNSPFSPGGDRGEGASNNPYLTATGGQNGGVAGGGGNGIGGGTNDGSGVGYGLGGGGIGGGNGTGGGVGGVAGDGSGDADAGGPALTGNPYRSSSERPGTAVPGVDSEKRPGTAVPGVDSGSSTAAPSRGVSANAAASATRPHPSPLAKGEGTERPEGYITGQPPREQAAQTTSSQPPPEGAQRGYALRPGEWQPTPEPPPKPRDDKQDKKDDDKHGGKRKESLAQKRGADWGLRDATRGSVGITRPIRVECYADRLLVVSERGPTGNKVVALGPRAESSIDTLISAVWEHMEAWGMAGRGMYWRPLLQFHVAPDAEQRFAELSALLEGSGLTVERK